MLNMSLFFMVMLYMKLICLSSYWISICTWIISSFSLLIKSMNIYIIDRISWDSFFIWRNFISLRIFISLKIFISCDMLFLLQKLNMPISFFLNSIFIFYFLFHLTFPLINRVINLLWISLFIWLIFNIELFY